jgi:hypothetical protein
MKRGITGEYQVTVVGGETVRAFIPPTKCCAAKGRVLCWAAQEGVNDGK